MPLTLEDLQARRLKLDEQIKGHERKQHADAVARVLAFMKREGVTLADLSVPAAAKAKPAKVPAAAPSQPSNGGDGKASVAPDPPPAPKKTDKRHGKVAAKYRDPVSGVTWTGRGRLPKWVAAAMKRGELKTLEIPKPA